jgi:hypothetical protein
VKLILSTLKKILFWPYERGSWQYDIMVVAILAFIFFAPNEKFHSHRSSAADMDVSAEKRPVFVGRHEIGAVGQDSLEQRISNMLSSKYGHRVEVIRVERVIDDSMQLTGYLVWEK